MNAVNLIPAERRSTGAPSLPGVPFLGLMAALALAFLGTVLYIGARDHVSTRQAELTHLQTGAAAWSSAAARFTPEVSAVKHRNAGFEQVATLLGQRYDWSILLGQLAGVMPARAALSSLSVPTAGGSATSTIQVAGCAASQSVVADTMIALRRLSGVSGVSLSSSTQGAGTGSCTLPVQFNLSLQFAPTATAVKIAADGSASTSDSTGTDQ